MGVSVVGYSGLQLKKAGGTPEEIDGKDFQDDQYVYLSPPANQWQADGLQTGIYSYRDSYEERLGSYGYFDEFRQKLAEMVKASYPEPQKGVVFGELLYGSDTYLLMGPSTFESLYDSFVSADGVAIEEKLIADHFDDYYQLYWAIKTAVKHARSYWNDDRFGAILIS